MRTRRHRDAHRPDTEAVLTAAARTPKNAICLARLSTRQNQDGQWNGVVWLASPNRVIAVSGNAPLDAVLDSAASLHTVTEHEWVTAAGWNGD